MTDRSADPRTSDVTPTTRTSCTDRFEALLKDCASYESLLEHSGWPRDTSPLDVRGRLLRRDVVEVTHNETMLKVGAWGVMLHEGYTADEITAAETWSDPADLGGMANFDRLREVVETVRIALEALEADGYEIREARCCEGDASRPNGHRRTCDDQPGGPDF